VKQKKTNKKIVETLTHDEAKRKNIPTAEFQSVVQKEAQAPLKIKYPRGVNGLNNEKENRNGDLDPQLVWRGKDEQDHAYFLGANDDPYKALKTTLKAEINQEAWVTLNSDITSGDSPSEFLDGLRAWQQSSRYGQQSL
jgi:hypothetical protein